MPKEAFFASKIHKHFQKRIHNFYAELFNENWSKQKEMLNGVNPPCETMKANHNIWVAHSNINTFTNFLFIENSFPSKEDWEREREQKLETLSKTSVTWAKITSVAARDTIFRWTQIKDIVIDKLHRYGLKFSFYNYGL